MGTEATLIYNLWIFSWLINLLRRLMGIIFGFGGRVLYMALETYHGQVTLTSSKQILQMLFLMAHSSQGHSTRALCKGTL